MHDCHGRDEHIKLIRLQWFSWAPLKRFMSNIYFNLPRELEIENRLKVKFVYFDVMLHLLTTLNV